MNAQPHSIEAEESLLSSCIADGPGIVSRCVTAGIGPRSFYEPKHGLVFECLLELIRRGVEISTGTLAEELKARGRLDQVGGYAFIVQVTERMPTTAQAGFFIARVSALSRQRRLITAATDTLAASQESGASWSDVWERVEPHLRAAQDAGADSRRRSLSEVAATAKKWRLSPDVRPVIPTGWPGWDRLASGVGPAELAVLAARPGLGKTTLACNIVEHLTAGGRAVAFFSLEMSSEELVDRLAIHRAGRNGMGADRHANAAVAAQIEEIGKRRGLHIFESEDAGSVAQIEANCRLLAAAPGGLGAVVIDYLQLVAPPTDTKREVREQQVAAMSRRFKLLARAIDCPVFLLAQLNRASEQEERRPRLSDLRESGAIEQDADRVWFLYRPKARAGDMPQAEDAATIDVCLYQAKCRNGPAGIEAVLKFHRPTFTFTT